MGEIWTRINIAYYSWAGRVLSRAGLKNVNYGKRQTLSAETFLRLAAWEKERLKEIMSRKEAEIQERAIAWDKLRGAVREGWPSTEGIVRLPGCPDCGSDLEIVEGQPWPFCPKCLSPKPQLLVMRVTLEGKRAVAIVPENLVRTSGGERL